MIFESTPLEGAWLVRLTRHADERGFFARSWCEQEAAAHELNPRFVQCSVSFNEKRGTLRGLHYQARPKPEVRLIRCTRGAIWDVIVDLRADSPDRGRWFAAELSEDNHEMIYVPPGFAHGFITLTDSAEILYQMSEFYEPTLARGVRWDDPAIGIAWPLPPTSLSPRDQELPLLQDAIL